jgi:hypothetical protein
MFKALSRFFRSVSLELAEFELSLDKIIEREEIKLEEAKRRHEEFEQKSAKEAGFTTVEEWRQCMDRLHDEIMR